jgi:IclR family transcriptional regulator, acetate operon repressor
VSIKGTLGLVKVTRTVKSAVRILEIFQLFDRIQRDATVSEIARELGYPLSSTSVLLSNLADMGFMCHGADQRSYFPTPRVTLLGAWIAPVLAPSGAVLSLMAELGEKTSETIILAASTRDQVQYLHVVPASTTMRMHVGPGTTRSLLSSGLGRLLLSTMSDERVRHLVFRYNEGSGTSVPRISLSALCREISTIRTQGYSLTLKGVTPGAAVLGMLIPENINGAPLAIGIGGWSRSMRQKLPQYLTLLRDSLERSL